MTLAGGLRDCLGELLGSGVPRPGDTDEPIQFFRQWLAERNLGLVPIGKGVQGVLPTHRRRTTNQPDRSV